MNIKFSIVVLVSSAASDLRKCLDSILWQSYENFEVLLIQCGLDAGKNMSLCEQYVQQNAKIKLFNLEYSDVSVAKNLGIQESTGDYLLFISADDWIETCLLEHLAFKVEAQPADLVGLDLRVQSEQTGQVSDSCDAAIYRALASNYSGSNLTSRVDSRLLSLEPMIFRQVYCKDFLLRYQFRFFEANKFSDISAYFRLLLMARKVALLSGVYYFHGNDNNKYTLENDQAILDLFNVLEDVRCVLKTINANQKVWARYIKSVANIFFASAALLENDQLTLFFAKAKYLVNQFGRKSLERFSQIYNEDQNALAVIAYAKYGRSQVRWLDIRKASRIRYQLFPCLLQENKWRYGLGKFNQFVKDGMVDVTGLSRLIKFKQGLLHRIDAVGHQLIQKLTPKE